MTNAELIAELRGHILSVPLTLLHDAADALEAAEKKIVELNTKCANLQSQINSMENEIEELMPKRGEWISDFPNGLFENVNPWKCSVCEKHYHFREDYCPNCGAKMDG